MARTVSIEFECILISLGWKVMAKKLELNSESQENRPAVLRRKASVEKVNVPDNGWEMSVGGRIERLGGKNDLVRFYGYLWSLYMHVFAYLGYCRPCSLVVVCNMDGFRRTPSYSIQLFPTPFILPILGGGGQRWSWHKY